eukprot:2433542-Amphidinium_carterae.1
MPPKRVLSPSERSLMRRCLGKLKGYQPGWLKRAVAKSKKIGRPKAKAKGKAKAKAEPKAKAKGKAKAKAELKTESDSDDDEPLLQLAMKKSRREVEQEGQNSSSSNMNAVDVETGYPIIWDDTAAPPVMAAQPVKAEQTEIVATPENDIAWLTELASCMLETGQDMIDMARAILNRVEKSVTQESPA